MTYLFSTRYIVTRATALTMALGLFASCAKNVPKKQIQDDTTVADTTSADNTKSEGNNMLAPKIKTNASGIITLAQCPTEYEGLKVVLTDDIMKATIYQDDQQLQTISSNDDEPLATDGNKSIHFMDANFDGYVDSLSERESHAPTARSSFGILQRSCS